MKRPILKLILLFLVLLGTVLLSMSYGAVSITFREVARLFTFQLSPSESSFSVLELRGFRVLTCALVGAVLSVVGSSLQRLLNNPLADPFVLGVSAGGTAGIAFATLAGFSFAMNGLPVQVFAALCGCLLALGALFGLQRRLRQDTSGHHVLLAGLIINAFCSSVFMLCMAFADRAQSFEIYRWLLGSVHELEAITFLYVLIVSLILLWMLIRSAPAIQALAFGDDFATGIGMKPKKIRSKTLFLCALLIAVSVSISGVIGFVGLIVPHIVKRFAFDDVRTEWIVSGWAGAVTLMLADTLSRTVVAPSELPTGVFTALIGAPCLALLLIRGERTQELA